MLLEGDRQRRGRALDTSVVLIVFIVPNPIGVSVQSAQFDRPLEIFGVKGVVEATGLADGMGLRSVETDVVERTQIVPLGKPFVFVEGYPLFPVALFGLGEVV